ncbi:hypothetical protein M501DRAFT_1057181 [Patellaria atrata CBS 101060]|uniref:Uncharacterized protein n=1 Tax=Patellaria atrata CBS 101060 TaxID=1346257 RepID=A0A9P4SDK3_9PEZI|nr:hypothetical protein M501DRAFT_1057181 [Patellaria atrata CBS 101060]
MTPRSSTRVSKQSARAIEAEVSSSLTRKRATSGSNSTSNAPTKKNKKSASKGSKKESLKASKNTENPEATNQAAAEALLDFPTQQSVVEEDQLSFSSGRDEVDDDAVLLTQQSESQPKPEPEPQQQSGRSKTPRKSATQQQLASTAEKLAAEEEAGKFNKGHVCWQNKRSITAADIVVNHYPCSAEILRRWNSEIKKGFASVEVPSQKIIVQMVTWKEALGRKRQQTEASATPTVASQASVDSGASSQIKQVLLVSQIRRMAPPEVPPPVPLFPPQKTQLSHAPPPNSSPLSADTDPVELLAEFFECLKLQPGFNTQQQVNILEETKVKMVEEQWSLDSLKPRKPDEGISQITWEEYGFKIGLLVRIRAKISDFKRLR